jgi:hypothetical protein
VRASRTSDQPLNANMNINVVAGPDYQTKFVTTMASDDLPDIMHIYNGYALAPNLPAFFKAQCADLTPCLAGDAAKEYPYLAAIPTYAWKNSVSAIDGALFLIPIQRHLPIFSSARANYDAQQTLMPLGVSDPTDGYYSATAWGRGQTADVHFQDGVIDIILGRRQFNEYDGLVKTWQSEAGETVRTEFMDAMAAARA